MATLNYSEIKTNAILSHGRESEMGNKKICIGTQNYLSLKEALLNTSLPSKLKRQDPTVRITVFPRGMNSAVFKNNPYVDHFQRFPKEVFGDVKTSDLQHHIIQLKEQKLGLKISPEPKPELFISSREKTKILKFLDAKLLPGNEGKPLCILHVWKSNHPALAPVEFWDTLVSKWNSQFRFWQVGIENDSAIQGCEYYFFQKKSPASARLLFALIQQSQAFVGIDSSPMHIARAFAVPSLIFLNPLAQASEERYHYHTALHHYGQIARGMEKANEFFTSVLKRKD